jgi:hypothetical protein
MTEHVLHELARLCDVGYNMAPRSTRRDQGALKPGELENLREGLSSLLDHPLPLLPAVRTPDASLIVVGPTHQEILRRMGRRLSERTVRGFIELQKGHFLDAANAMVRARDLGLVLSERVMLRADRLPYHSGIPLYVVRHELGRQKRG